MGLSGKNCYNPQWYLDLRERDTTLFNTVLIYIEGFLGILWEVTRKQRFIGDTLRRNGFLWLKKNDSDMTGLLLSCETVSTHFSVFWTMSNAVQWFFQLPEHICLEAMHALLFRHWTKIKILTSFHCRNFRQVTRDQKWTRSHNHRKVLCYLEVTNTRFREPSCLSSSTKALLIMYHMKQCRNYTTFQRKCCRESNFICKCR